MTPSISAGRPVVSDGTSGLAISGTPRLALHLLGAARATPRDSIDGVPRSNLSTPLPSPRHLGSAQPLQVTGSTASPMATETHPGTDCKPFSRHTAETAEVHHGHHRASDAHGSESLGLSPRPRSQVRSVEKRGASEPPTDKLLKRHGDSTFTMSDHHQRAVVTDLGPALWLTLDGPPAAAESVSCCPTHGCRRIARRTGPSTNAWNRSTHTTRRDPTPMVRRAVTNLRFQDPPTPHMCRRKSHRTVDITISDADDADQPDGPPGRYFYDSRMYGPQCGDPE